jgi:hypothetical protein
MTMEQSDISFRLQKNQCLFQEDPWVPIVSLYVCTSREPQCHLCSRDHKNMTPLSQEKIPCDQGIKFCSIFKVLGMRRKQCHCVRLVFLIPAVYLLCQMDAV